MNTENVAIWDNFFLFSLDCSHDCCKSLHFGYWKEAHQKKKKKNGIEKKES